MTLKKFTMPFIPISTYVGIGMKGIANFDAENSVSNGPM